MHVKKKKLKREKTYLCIDSGGDGGRFNFACVIKL